MSIEILKVQTAKQLKDFIGFPNQLYKKHPYYVPPLQIAVKWMLGQKNPFLKHSRIALFLAMRNRELLGRIAAIYNSTHLKRYDDHTGFFGFFDAVDNQQVANQLFDAAYDWLKQQGLCRMMGPANLTTNDSCGILVEGFLQPPMMLMPYNFEYYNNLCACYGMTKAVDLFSYRIDGTAVINRYENVLNRSSQQIEKMGISLRPISKNNFDKDVRMLRHVYNKCNEDNWGFMPLNEQEFCQMAKDLIRVTSHDLAIMVEKDGLIIGFIIALPNYNQPLKHVKEGRLLPFGWASLLWYKRMINSGRIMILGLLKEYSGLGIDMLMYKHIKQALNGHNIFTSEACYVLENNFQMNSILKKIDGEPVKKYRMYQYQKE
jgi:GNAT superfamily N-acetyltransferase